MDKLVNDKCYDVRWKVAGQGYGLDKLIKDEDKYVRAIVTEQLENNGYKDINEWKKDNPDKVYRKNNKTKGEER